MQEVYNLKNDGRRIKLTQKTSLDNISEYGLKIQDGLLFGTEAWFKAIDSGVIPKHIINGVISNVYMSGHNDYPVFEIENNDGKTTWTRDGMDSAYKVGRNVELVYVNQKSKRPFGPQGSNTPCVIQIKIAVE